MTAGAVVTSSGEGEVWVVNGGGVGPGSGLVSTASSGVSFISSMWCRSVYSRHRVMPLQGTDRK